MKLVRGEDIENNTAFHSCLNTLSKSEAEKLVVITLQNIEPHRQNIIYGGQMTLQSEHSDFFFPVHDWVSAFWIEVFTQTATSGNQNAVKKTCSPSPPPPPAHPRKQTSHFVHLACLY